MSSLTRWTWWSIALALLLIPHGSVMAEEIPGQAFGAVRPLGMGGAFTAVSNDESSVWTNPAGIGRSRKARTRGLLSLSKVPNLIIGANGNTREFYQAFSGAQDKSIASVLSSAGNITGKPLWARGALFPVSLFDFGRQSPVAFGIYSNTVVSALIESDSTNVASVNAVSDVGAVLTLGWNDPSNRLNAALQLRPVSRYAYENRIPSANLIDKKALNEYLRKDSNRADGLGVDAGLMYTVADFWFPTIGVAVLNLPTGCKADYLNPYSQTRQNVCGNKFHGTFGNADALSVLDPTDVRVGLSITPRITRSANLRMALDAHNLPVGSASQSFGLQSIPFSALVHAGVEFFVGNPLLLPEYSVRFGVNQGFITSGFSFAFGALELDFATYGVDVSSTAKALEDRRYLASLSLGF